MSGIRRIWVCLLVSSLLYSHMETKGYAAWGVVPAVHCLGRTPSVQVKAQAPLQLFDCSQGLLAEAKYSHDV